MSALPRARISIFHADVKERCVASIGPFLGLLGSPPAIANLVEKLQTDFNFIFPRRLNTNANVLVGSPQTGRPYRSSILMEAIRHLYFAGNAPFITQHQDQFPSCRGTNNEVIWEVPKAMVALVSTAYYSALHEWSTGKRKQHVFSADTYMEAYNCHITNLNRIESDRNPTYHNMMAEIYEFAVNGGDATVQPPPTAPMLDLTMLDD